MSLPALSANARLFLWFILDFICIVCCSYVAELLANRILRFAARPAGVYHQSVFHQFAGRMGPSALAIDEDGNLYVARYDFAGACLFSFVVHSRTATRCSRCFARCVVLFRRCFCGRYCVCS